MKQEKIQIKRPASPNLPKLIEGFFIAYKAGNENSVKNLLTTIKNEDTGVDQVFLGLCKINEFKYAMELQPTNIDFPDKLSAYTGLTYAVSYKNYEAVNYFIEKGAKVNAIVGIAPWKTTALKILATDECDDNTVKIFELILKNGGDITQNSSGTNALDTIYYFDNYVLMNELLKCNVGDKVFLRYPLDQLTLLLQQLNKYGILKAFQDNNIILTQLHKEAAPFEGTQAWLSNHEISDDKIANIELVGTSTCDYEKITVNLNCD